MQAKLIVLLTSILIASSISVQAFDISSVVEVSKVQSFIDLKFEGIVRPRYDASCGSAVLATILHHYYDEPVTESDILNTIFEIRKENSAPEDWALSLLDLKFAGEKLGYTVQGLKGNLDGLKSLNIPSVVLLRGESYSRFVIVQQVKDNRVFIADPIKGHRALDTEEFLANWNGVLLVVSGKNQSPRNWTNTPSPKAPAFDNIQRLLDSSFSNSYSLGSMEF